MQVNLTNMQGKVVKNAEVLSNDPQNGRLNLRIQGIVKAFIEVTPSNMVFFQGMAEQVSEETVDLIASSDPFHIAKVENSLEDQIAYRLETVEEGRHYRLKISNKLKKGDYHGVLKIVTDHPKKPEILIRVNGNITGEINVRPMSLNIGKPDSSPREPPRTGVVVVMSNRNTPFHIAKLTYDEQMISVVQKPIADKQGFTLEVTPKMENIPAGTQHQVPLLIETDVDPRETYSVEVNVINK